MYIKSSLSPQDYRNAIKASLSNFSNHYSERFTGFFIGKFFYLGHNCEHEFGNRITPSCAAVGYMKEIETGCELHYLTFRGLFRPIPFIITLLICIAICLLVHDPEYYPWKHILIGVSIAVFFATFHTILEVTSRRSKESYDALEQLMIDPIAPFR